eukprot:TRINITY_DN817_c1_g1_i1.p1 TRINITY_DN817_c1_g1~~TRINITY_DN817_c1_g1_i1.p1  ORF type:complete len:318 (+),score=99.90 TRINITY_DN817_c1_g1_i1:461-1414(+)
MHFSANQQTDPVQRLLGVIAFFVNMTKKEAFEKKPSNSILGEEHLCWVETEGGRVNYVAEQVSHHPPVSAFYVENIAEKQKISMLGNFETGGIKFHGNSVGITVKGSFRLEMTNPTTGHIEQYIANKPFPNITIKNVILGTKREPWEGEVQILCPQTKLKAVLNYKEEGWSSINVVKGVISREENGESTPLVNIIGEVSKSLSYYNYEDRKSSDKKEEKLIEFEGLKPNVVQYLAPEKWTEKSSLKTWKDMYDAIVANDMPAADAAKKKVEVAQRTRRTEGKDYVPAHFSLNTASNTWELNQQNVRELFNNEDNVSQ